MVQTGAPEHLDQLFEFFGVFVDRCHHGKEEALLFPALEAVGIGNNGGPIGVMLRERAWRPDGPGAALTR